MYRERFDLLYRREASRPNEIWQADHTPLDIWVLDERGQPARPWLTVILDDYSRAVAGFRVSLAGAQCVADRADAAPGDLAQERSTLARLRHPGHLLHRSRHRLHLAAPGAGRRRPQDAAGVLDGRAEPRGRGRDRAVLRDRPPDVRQRRSQAIASASAPATATPTPDPGGAGRAPERFLPRRLPPAPPRRDRASSPGALGGRWFPASAARLAGAARPAAADGRRSPAHPAGRHSLPGAAATST